MHPFKYEASLFGEHPDMPADVICRSVPLEADYAAAKGDKRIAPSGRELRGPQPFTVCTFPLGSSTSSDEFVVDFLMGHNSKLAVCRDFFREIRTTGGKIEYSIGWYSEGNTGEVFDLAFWGECVDLGIEFSIDSYDRD